MKTAGPASANQGKEGRVVTRCPTGEKGCAIYQRNRQEVKSFYSLDHRHETGEKRGVEALAEHRGDD